MDDVRVLNDYGLLDPETIEQTKEAIWRRHGGKRDEAPWRLFVHVEVIGRRGEQTVRRVYEVSHPDWGQEGTGRMTGTCAAVGAQLLGRHGTRGRGFVDPEAYYDPGEFLSELERRGTVTVRTSEHAILST
jgi:saccharopine dehydrogenase-like NADP-dependent oxidoreductase